MTGDAELVCPDCEMLIPKGAPGGFCPLCLMGSQTLGRASDHARSREDWPSPEELNSQIKDVEISELLGYGGMGAVYKARQPRLNRAVAVKILPVFEALEDREAFDERFEREAQSMAKLSHPNVVAVYDFGETASGQLYIVMEYVEGSDLEVLIRSGRVKPEDALCWVPQICEALQYAHANGVVHRDVKPSNVLVSADGKSVKIADFGIAQLGGKDEGGARLTMTDMVVGTPEYLSPEQREGGSQVDHRADIFSLGVLIYEMMTGKLPGDEIRAGLKKISESESQLNEVVLRAMSPEPNERYQCANELSEDLIKIALQKGPPKKETGWKRWIFSGLVAVGVIGLAGWWLSHSSSPLSELESQVVLPPIPESTGGAWPLQCTSIKAVENDRARPVHARHITGVYKTGWKKEAFWENGPPPVEGEDPSPYHYYLYAGRTLPLFGTTRKYHFGGLSLTAAAGSAVMFFPKDPEKEVVFKELNLDGGHLGFLATGGKMSGLINVLAASSIKTRGTRLGTEPILAATLRGSQPLSYSGVGIRLTAQNSNFSGGWRIRGNVYALADQSLGTGSILVESGKVDSEYPVRIDGALDLWNPGKIVLDQDWSVKALRVDGLALSPGVYRFTDLEERGHSDLFLPGIGALEVRESFKEEKVEPFEIPAESEVFNVSIAQKKGDSMHQIALGEDGHSSPLIQPMRDGKIVVSPTHYVIESGGLLRTEPRSLSTNYFGGLSLTVLRGGRLCICSSEGSTVIHDLRLKGGQIVVDLVKVRLGMLGGGIGGKMQITEKSMVIASGPIRKRFREVVTIDAELEGAGALEVDIGVARRLIVRSRDNHQFVGGWHLLSGTLEAKARDALGAGPVTLQPEARLEVSLHQRIGVLTAPSLENLHLESDLHVTGAVIDGQRLASGEHVLNGSRGKLVVAPE